MRLLSRPTPVETVALLPDHPPVSFTWRGVRRRVRRGDGPERLSASDNSSFAAATALPEILAYEPLVTAGRKPNHVETKPTAPGQR